MSIVLFSAFVGGQTALRLWSEIPSLLTTEALEENATLQAEESSQTGMVRSESEFSLGLNRSASIGDHINELGLCDAGHVAVSITRYTLYSVMIVYAANKWWYANKSNEVR